MARIITFISGKSGVGKTNLCMNLALELSKTNQKVCILDTDSGENNLIRQFNIEAKHAFDPIQAKEDLLNLKWEDLLVKNFNGIDILTTTNALKKLENEEIPESGAWLDKIPDFPEYDYILIDTVSEVSKSVMAYCIAASQVALVITPESASVSGAFELLSLLSANGFSNRIMVVLNRSINRIPVNKIKNRIQEHIPLEILPMGSVLYDAKIKDATKTGELFITHYATSVAAEDIKSIVRNMSTQTVEQSHDVTFKQFWKKCIEFSTGPIVPMNTPTPYQKPFFENLPKKETVRKELADIAQDQCVEMEIKDLLVTDGKDINQLLGQLVEAVSNISTELKYIRKMFGNENLQNITPDSSKSIRQKESPIIPLDFDAFLRHRESHKEEQTKNTLDHKGKSKSK